ncbi:hypothetical protein CTI12_AA534030 [Artemisia annua]|uniref:ATPase AAA-type core domain-containing protein n=1 Tax=Artemisia annua TaxID=35608 RepID=A0A2U1KX60_ARTAN|nr:hypothetical protein CTI12_AA534030 [Artemisia annua]
MSIQFSSGGFQIGIFEATGSLSRDFNGADEGVPKSDSHQYYSTMQQVMQNPQFMNMAERLGSAMMQLCFIIFRAKFKSAQEITGVSFDDFARQEYIKRELQEIVRILKNDEEFQNKGIHCPKGVLLHGPPGTGKTLLAKAIVGEAGLPFFAANGTDFVEMFVEVAASCVKDLFNSSKSFLLLQLFSFTR